MAERHLRIGRVVQQTGKGGKRDKRGEEDRKPPDHQGTETTSEDGGIASSHRLQAIERVEPVHIGQERGAVVAEIYQSRQPAAFHLLENRHQGGGQRGD